MTYFQRYKDGECAAVWAELAALGSTVRRPDLFADARSVARATMERVAKNVELLVGRLSARGYEFGVYPDGDVPAVSFVFVRPNAASLGHVEELENLAGTIPISLRTFWEVVGSVSFIGRSHEDWPEYSDPLCIDPPWSGIVEYRYWRAAIDRGASAPDLFPCPIAPDVKHKDNVSGGAPYSIKLPDPNADALVRGEWHNVYFVQYLRIAILEWGGFPGLSRFNPMDKWRAKKLRLIAQKRLPELTHDLVAF